MLVPFELVNYLREPRTRDQQLFSYDSPRRFHLLAEHGGGGNLVVILDAPHDAQGAVDVVSPGHVVPSFLRSGHRRRLFEGLHDAVEVAVDMA